MSEADFRGQRPPYNRRVQRSGAARLTLVGLLAGPVLMGAVIASGASPAAARPHELADTSSRVKPHPPRTTLTAKVAPASVAAGEPATLTARLRPATRGVRLVVQRRAAGRWVAAGKIVTRAGGRAVLRLSTATVGTQRMRVLRTSPRTARRATSKPATLTVVAASAACTPRIALVDTQATEAARCLAARLDRWQAAGAMGVGQQLNVSNADYTAPLTRLGRQLPVVGLDLKELVDSEGYGFPVAPIDHLTSLAQQGAVLSISWHPDNPGTGGRYDDRGWTDLGALLEPASPAYASFWADADAGLGLVRRLQDAGVAVVFRPFHEANGDWFWWGDPAPTIYRALWAALQQRAAGLGIHNILWAYSFNADTGDNTSPPVRLLPARVDLAGMDSYSSGTLSTAGYAEVAAKVARMAFTEVGPYQVGDGSWDPAAVGQAARSLASPPLWSMFWFDDPGGLKQLSSLHRGPTWLGTCPNGFCTVAR